MFQTTQEAVAWIEKWDKFSIKLGLERMEWMLDRLDHPERVCRVIHVAGTNGKGSTVQFITSMLREAGYAVGTFTSPALERFNDRITFNGEVITDEDLLAAANMIYESVEGVLHTEFGAPTEFEVITLIALVYFARIAYCDFSIMEVGLGGRFDSTNIVLPIIGAITNIGMDHVKQLGPTIADIAKEKAGIIKSGMPLVTGARGEALRVIEETVKAKRAKIYELEREFIIESMESVPDGEMFSVRTPFGKYDGLHISMFGTHQIENASIALMVVEYLRVYFALDINEGQIRNGLKKANWPGRFETVSDNPKIIMDGAHNIDGVTALVKTVQNHYPDHHVKVLFASLVDKDNEAILNRLSELSDDITLTTFDYHRAASPEEIAVYAGGNPKIALDWQKALSDLKASVKENEILLITGSLYFISEIKSHIKDWHAK
ncbi:MAG: bifunctional folylpolyglutamate synthase/dihydrofolate synthase [Tuberibacillus sp.]